MVPSHQHLIVRAEVNKPFTSRDKDKVSQWLIDLVWKLGMQIISGPHVAYADAHKGNKGITACVLIQTSHIVLHVWDEQQPGLVQLDVYSCLAYNPEIIIDHLSTLEPIKCEKLFLDRKDTIAVQ